MLSLASCLGFGGLNEKVAVLPRRSATPWLGAFVRFYVDGVGGCHNTEKFLQNIATIDGIPIEKVDSMWLPTLDIRDVKTNASHGRLRQEGGCLSLLYIGGFAGGQREDQRCECVAEGHCDAVVRRLCSEAPVTARTKGEGVREEVAVGRGWGEGDGEGEHGRKRGRERWKFRGRGPFVGRMPPRPWFGRRRAVGPYRGTSPTRKRPPP